MRESGNIIPRKKICLEEIFGESTYSQKFIYIFMVFFIYFIRSIRCNNINITIWCNFIKNHTFLLNNNAYLLNNYAFLPKNHAFWQKICWGQFQIPRKKIIFSTFVNNAKKGNFSQGQLRTSSSSPCKGLGCGPTAHTRAARDQTAAVHLYKSTQDTLQSNFCFLHYIQILLCSKDQWWALGPLLNAYIGLDDLRGRGQTFLFQDFYS